MTAALLQSRPRSAPPHHPRARRSSPALRAAAVEPPPAADAEALRSLLLSADASCALRLGVGERGRGLFASAAAREGDTLLRVGLRHALVVTTGGSRPLVEALLAARRSEGLPAELAALLGLHALPAPPRLAAALLWATGRGGAAAPAADAVWTAAAALLPPDGFAVEAEAADESAAAEAAALAASHAPGLAAQLAARGVAAAGWRWALACVASRTFGADAWGRTGAKEGLLGAFVPAADLLNHSFDPNCQFRLRADARVFEVFARRPLAAGEEACISYGEGLCNAQLRARYGFDVADNPNGEEEKVAKPRINW